LVRQPLASSRWSRKSQKVPWNRKSKASRSVTHITCGPKPVLLLSYRSI
jgi:hypothetical protein